MKTLKNKFLVPITVVVALALITTVVSISLISNRLLHKTIQNEMDSKIVTLSGSVNQYLTDRQKDIKSWGELEICSEFLKNSENPDVRERTNRQLKLLADNFPNYKSLNICSPEGEVLASSSPGKGKLDKIASGGKIVNIFKRDYFQAAMKGKLGISDVIISVATNKPGFSVAAPIKDGDKILGVIYAFVDMKLFSDSFIKPFRIGSKGQAFILNNQGQYIAHRDSSVIMKDSLAQTNSFIKKVVQTKNGMAEQKWQGENVMFSYHDVEQKDWIVVANANKDEIFKPLRKLKYIGTLVLILSIIITIAVVTFLIRNVLSGIHSITEASRRLAMGDLNKKIDYTSDDEMGAMADAFREMQENLSAKSELAHTVATGDLTGEIPIASKEDLLGQSLMTMIQNTSSVLQSIQEVSHQVDVGSSQVSSLSSDLSDGSIRSAAAIEEISASMEEIKSRSIENSSTANDVSKLMNETKSIVAKASNEMETLEQSMDKINHSSLEIEKIIKVIDDIAFQTNLLALNAAVEAARAGQHGKGFAVVADEVRSLAGRSAKAAKETSQLIKDAVVNAGEGSNITRNTVEVFSSIENSVQEVANLVTLITRGSNDQTSSITQIVSGIQQIEGVIHQNSASSEETAAASQELSSQAEHLKEALGRFKMKNSSEDATYFDNDEQYA